MKILVFGGTTEGRELSELLSDTGADVTLSVATEFGREMAQTHINILSDRLEEQEMRSLLKQKSYDCVVDATHPFAVSATKNIYSACQAAGIKYYRIKRPPSDEMTNIISVPDGLAAADVLNKTDEKALLTIGSKELEAFTQIDNYAARLYIRILPMEDSLKKALDLGFRSSHIICMQGPFGEEMNKATLKMTGAGYLVTKDSGDIGGYEAKVAAARELGCQVVVITRPIEEEGYTLHGLLEELGLSSKEKGDNMT
jgi:precorrin-6x reductase